MVVDDDGRGLFSTGLRHGDALHVGDLDPSRPGLEVFGIHENEEATVALKHAGRGALRRANGPDPLERPSRRGRRARPGCRHRSAPSRRRVLDARRRSACSTSAASASPPRRRQRTSPCGGTPIRSARFSTATGSPSGTGTTGPLQRLLTATGAMSNNGTKATPSLSADILGDWREEVIWRTDGQPVAADLHDDDSRHEEARDADARSAVSRGDRVAERRLQPAAASAILHRRGDEGTAEAVDRGATG